MTTPTQYELTYEDPCQQEEGCSVQICGNKIKENNRPQVFCEDVTIEKSLTTGVITTISPLTVDELGFCPGVVETLTGPVTVLLLCGEGGPAGGSSPTGATCPDKLKVNGPFVVVGEACFNKSVKIESDAEVSGNFSSKDFSAKGNSKVSGDFSVGGSVQVEGNFISSGDVITTGSIFTGDQICNGNSFSSQATSETLFTGKIVVNGYLYQEQVITALVDGEQMEITVLVKTSKLSPPKKEPIPAVTVNSPVLPVAPCPSVEC